MGARADGEDWDEEFVQQKSSDNEGQLDYNDDINDQGSNHVSDFEVPNQVVEYVNDLYSIMTTRRFAGSPATYEFLWTEISEEFYPSERLPPIVIARQMIKEESTIFDIMYKELYYRHVFSQLVPTAEDYYYSYANYCDLFNLLIQGDCSSLEMNTIPQSWIWDILNGFISQFQSYYIYLQSAVNVNDETVELLKEKNDIWEVHCILNVLYSLIQKSEINEQSSVSDSEVKGFSNTFGPKPLYRRLGYSALVCLLRVQCILGDFSLGIKETLIAKTEKKSFMYMNIPCYATLCYYLGFSYMMVGRYSETIKTITRFLLFGSRNDRSKLKAYQNGYVNSLRSKMYAILAICVFITQYRVEEGIYSTLRDQYGDAMLKMQNKEDALPVMQDLFRKVCPKFIPPVVKNPFPETDCYMEAQTYQLNCFLDEVSTYISSSALAMRLKFYTAIKVEKLSLLLKVPESEVLSGLIVLKNRLLRHKLAPDSYQERLGPSLAGMNFFIENGIVHIQREENDIRVGKWFIKHINKLNRFLSGTC